MHPSHPADGDERAEIAATEPAAAAASTAASAEVSGAAAPGAAPGALDRRRFFTLAAAAGGLGLGATAFPDVLAAAARADVEAGAKKMGKITRKILAAAEDLAGVHFTDAHRDQALKGLASVRDDYVRLREIPLANDVPPALRFDPRPAGFAGDGARPGEPDRTFQASSGIAAPLPTDHGDLAYLPLLDLARLVQSRQITSSELTHLYLARLRRLDPMLHAVITFTEERALREAEQADREIAAGRYRGPLHGIPWGAKDLLAARGYPTTWGSVPFKSQVIDDDATVVERLTAAGAVLVAKTAVGELAWGDVWFGGTTKNPWKLDQGSSGSSAGSASATAAGAVGFAIGTETLGSIVSPSTRTGCTGLRPTFGRVSRHGAMALAWSMDKIGVLARQVEDCAAVFQAIYGPDGRDETVVDAPFRWEPARDPGRLRLGYAKALFEERPEKADAEWEEQHALDLASVEALRGLGWELRPFELPTLPLDAISFILSAESAAAFDELTRSGRVDLLVRQEENAWPNVFRQGRMIPAVEYIQANRVRTLVVRDMARRMEGFDAYVAPSFAGNNLLLGNLTGYPAVVLPNGFRKDGTPGSITFTGKLFGEADLLAIAKAYQDATGFHRRHPKL